MEWYLGIQIVRWLSYREQNFMQQQRVASKLSRLAAGRDDGSYTWWAITSLLLQARAASSGLMAPLVPSHRYGRISYRQVIRYLQCDIPFARHTRCDSRACARQYASQG